MAMEEASDKVMIFDIWIFDYFCCGIFVFSLFATRFSKYFRPKRTNINETMIRMGQEAYQRMVERRVSYILLLIC
jgi:hypothetical protein